MRSRFIEVVVLLVLSIWCGSRAEAGFWDRIWARNVPSETIEAAIGYLGRIEGEAAASSIAAAATDVGHWRFANRAGEMFTASGAVEITRGLATLAPDAGRQPSNLRIYLTPDSVLRHAASIEALPKTASLFLLLGNEAFPLLAPSVRDRGWSAVAGKGLVVAISSRAELEEALLQLRRIVSRDTTRVLAFDPGGPTGVRRAPEIEANSRRAKVDAVDPGHVAGAFRALAGQLVLAGGRIDGEQLVYKSHSGVDGSIGLTELFAAATRADSDVVVLATSSARQPGSRNLLWQQVEFANLDKALAARTLGDLLHVLAGEPAEMLIKGVSAGPDRFELVATPRRDTSAAPVAAVKDAVLETWSGIVSETAGALSVGSLRASTTSAARRAELGRRLVPLVPSALQLGYALLLVTGLAAWPVLARWWRLVWPDEEASEYGNWWALVVARIVRWGVLVVFFVPIASLPALLVRLSGAVKEIRRVSQANSTPLG